MSDRRYNEVRLKKVSISRSFILKGVVLAFLSSLALAKEVVAQSRMETVSAQTVLPSRGHKPTVMFLVMSCNGYWTEPDPSPDSPPPSLVPCLPFSDGTLISDPGFVIDINTTGGIHIFKQLHNGSAGQGYIDDIDGDTVDVKNLTCTWLRVRDGMENIIKTEKCIGGSYTPGLADIGYYIKVQTTPQSDITDAESKGYTPLPASGDTWSITSSAPVMLTPPGPVSPLTDR